jgi:Ca2+-binding EF-hand superfamily protein
VPWLLRLLSGKLLKDMKRFDRLMWALRDADEEGNGYVDKEVLVDLMYIHVSGT